MSMRTMRFPANFKYLDEIREFVAGIATQGGFEGKEVYSIQLAADEAASNIIEHAYEGIPDGEIEISCGMKNDTLTIIMLDRGKAFSPATVQPPNLKANLSKRKIGGLGIYLMRKLMDEVQYETIPGKGNRLTLLKRRS
jgi:serine/threonine-protein kinase RsbW